jgi:hypothetical protein
LVKHVLFNSHGKLSTIKSQLKSLQNRFDLDSTIECHGVYFSSKTDMVAWFAKNELTIRVFCDALVANQTEATNAMVEAQQKISVTRTLKPRSLLHSV